MMMALACWIILWAPFILPGRISPSACQTRTSEAPLFSITRDDEAALLKIMWSISQRPELEGFNKFSVRLAKRRRACPGRVKRISLVRWFPRYVRRLWFVAGSTAWPFSSASGFSKAESVFVIVVHLANLSDLSNHSTLNDTSLAIF